MLVLIIAVIVASGLIAYAVSKSKNPSTEVENVEDYKKVEPVVVKEVKPKKVEPVVVEEKKPKKELKLKEKKVPVESKLAQKKTTEKKAAPSKKTSAKKQSNKK
jgi:hypothetical protein